MFPLNHISHDSDIEYNSKVVFAAFIIVSLNSTGSITWIDDP